MIDIMSGLYRRILMASDNRDEFHVDDNFDMVDVAMAMMRLSRYNRCYYWRPYTICWPIEIAEQLHVRRDTAGFVAKLYQTSYVEQPTSRCNSCYQIGIRCS